MKFRKDIEDDINEGRFPKAMEAVSPLKETRKRNKKKIFPKKPQTLPINDSKSRESEIEEGGYF